MNNLSTLGVITSFIFSVSLNGGSINSPGSTENSAPSGAYVINNSNTTIYYKPESFKDNPGFDTRAAYPIGPGQILFAPVDAISTPAIGAGKVYRIPTGGKIIVNESGIPEPGNLIAQAGVMLPSYGLINVPNEGFAMLANYKMTISLPFDIVKQ